MYQTVFSFPLCSILIFPCPHFRVPCPVSYLLLLSPVSHLPHFSPHFPSFYHATFLAPSSHLFPRSFLQFSTLSPFFFLQFPALFLTPSFVSSPLSDLILFLLAKIQPFNHIYKFRFLFCFVACSKFPYISFSFFVVFRLAVDVGRIALALP